MRQPAVRARVYSEERNQKLAAANLGKKHPFKNRPPLTEQHKAQISRARKGKPFPTKRGGNGSLSEPQRLLLASLGEGWKAEHAVSTGPRRPGWPTNLKIDLAHQESMVAVELDGHSHRSSAKIRAADARKDKFLTDLGWNVFRLWNWDVMADLEKHSMILRCVATRAIPSTVS
jgi:hypothetical protein